MSDIHITCDLLRAVGRGTVSPRLLTDLGLRHLMHLCPHCAREITAWRAEQAHGRDYRHAFETLPRLLEHHTGELAARQAEAARDLEELLALPREKRMGKVARARRRFRGPAFVHLLIDESRNHVFNDPEEAFHRAELARSVVHSSPSMPGAFDLVALATAHMGNARKAAGRLREAEEHFAHVRYVVTTFGVTDTEVLAELALLEGALRKEQRQFPAAEELLSQAVLLYTSIDLAIEAARALLVLAATSYHEGSPDRAAETARTALQHLHPDADRRLYVSARHNLALYLAESGSYLAAEEILDADRDLSREFSDPWTQLRVSWLEGKIAAGTGKCEIAEEAFRTTRKGFIAGGKGFDAALASLDLALLYARDGRMAEVRELAEEMVPIFEAQDVHREAAAALLLFQEAARGETLTAAFIQRLVRYLRDARSDPSLRFEERR